MFCSKCGIDNKDTAKFCKNCGAVLEAEVNTDYSKANAEKNTNYNASAYNTEPFIPEWDHTNEFTPQDISDNKVFAMSVYILGVTGIFIALIASNTSPYVRFHVRQALKFLVIETLSMIAMFVLFWTIIVPIAAAIFIFVLAIVKIICFVSICQGKANEPPIIRAFGFLK